MQASGQAKYETTAAIAETETSTARLAEKVHGNAEIAQNVAQQAASEAQHHAVNPAVKPASEATTAANAVSQSPGIAAVAAHTQDVAEDAAVAAQTKGPAVTGNLKDVVPAVKAKTDAAVEEGKQDVNNAAAAGQGYLQQAISIAGGAIASAQSYIAGSGNIDEASGTTATPSTTTTTGTTGTSAIDTAKAYAVQAHSAVQPHLETAARAAQSGAATTVQVAQPHVEAAARAVQSGAATTVQAAQPHIEAAAKAIQSGAISTVQAAQEYLANSTIPGVSSAGTVPAKTAPLETGPHTTDTLYPEGGDAKKHGENV